MKNIQSLNAQKSIHNNIRAKSKSTDNIPGPYKKVAKDIETQYLKLMIEQMNKTAPSSTGDSSAEQIYKSLLSDERAKLMAQTNDGEGLQKLILDQIYPERLRNRNAFEMYSKNKSDNDKVIRNVSKEAEHE